MAKLEFLYVSPYTEIKTVHIGIFPPFGRYRRREMARRDQNVFWYEADIDHGDVYYHFFVNGDFSTPVFNKMEDLASSRDPLKRSSRHVGTLPFCLLEFQESPQFLWLEPGGGPRLRAISHHGWVRRVDVVVPGIGEFPGRRVFSFKNKTYWDARLPELDGGTRFCLRVRGHGRHYYVHRFGCCLEDIQPDQLFSMPDETSVAADPAIEAGTVG